MDGLTRSKAKAKVSEALSVTIQEAEEQLVQINKSIKRTGLRVLAMECVCKSLGGKKHGGAGCICLHYDAQERSSSFLALTSRSILAGAIISRLTKK